MINRIYENIKRRKDSNILIEELLLKIEEIRSKFDVIAFCPDNTDHHWLGIKNATISLFPANHISLPQYYSQAKLVEKDLNLLIQKICLLNFRVLIFNGFPEYFIDLFKKIKLLNNNIKIILLFAGSASEYTYAEHQKMLVSAIDLARNNVIDKIGFNKKGLAEAVAKIFGIKCGRYFVKTPTNHPFLKEKTFSGKILKIGILGSNNFNKNLHSQVIAALQINDAEVYVLNDKIFGYLKSNRIKGINKQLSHADFISLLSEMDVNYYVCFSESWGQIVTESLSVGVPCFTSATSGIFDYNRDLENALVVRDYDDVTAIAKQTEALASNYKAISEKGVLYIHELNEIADKAINNFLHNI